MLAQPDSLSEQADHFLLAFEALARLALVDERLDFSFNVQLEGLVETQAVEDTDPKTTK